MAHEAFRAVVSGGCLFARGYGDSVYLVIRSSMLRGSRMNVGSVTRLRSAPGLSWDIM